MPGGTYIQSLKMNQMKHTIDLECVTQCARCGTNFRFDVDITACGSCGLSLETSLEMHAEVALKRCPRPPRSKGCHRNGTPGRSKPVAKETFLEEGNSGVNGSRDVSPSIRFFRLVPVPAKRKPKGEGDRSGSERVKWRSAILKNGQKKAIPRISGSKPLKRKTGTTLSQADRNLLMARMTAQYDKLSEKGSPKGFELYFRMLLLERGDYVGGIVNETGQCRDDGNVYTYARYLRKFMEAGIFRKVEEFVPRNRHMAVAFAMSQARKRAPTQRVRRKMWHELTEHQKGALVDKLFNNLMHGFDDFASCLAAKRVREYKVSVSEQMPPTPQSPSSTYRVL